MKSIISYLLAASIALPNVTPAAIPLAEEILPESNTAETSSSSSEATSSSGEAGSSSSEASSSSSEASSSSSEASSSSTEESEDADNETDPAPIVNVAGMLEVKLKRALPVEKDIEATVSIAKNGVQILKKQMTLAKTASDAQVSFENLENGEYTVTITAEGFEDWQQTVKITEREAVSLEIYTGYLAYYDYVQGAQHPGALQVGDADEDGKVTYADTTMLIDAIDAEATTGKMDFNGDGLVDLLDLEYIATTLDNAGRNNTATVQTRLLSVAVPQEGTVVQGNVSDLLTNTAPVQLMPESGETISEETPVAVSFDFASQQQDATKMQTITVETSQQNPVSDGYFTVAYLNEMGEEIEMEVPIVAGASLARAGGVSAVADENGNIVIDFGSQIAVKKVTFYITGTKNNTNLAEISKVEFLNGMEERIPAPEMNIPTSLSGEAGDKEFLLTWDEQPNVTGYQVEITYKGQTEVRTTSTNQMMITSFAEKKLVNNTEYTVRVQSINGEWSSGYSEAIVVRPMASKVPFAPDSVKVEGAYRALNVSWKAMEDTDSYSVYYRPYNQGEYILAAENITDNRYTISNLEPGAKYQVYVIGKNDMGYSPASLVAVGETASINPVKMPEYKLINTSNGEGEITANIKSVEIKRPASVANMVGSILDEGARTAFGLVDNNESSYYRVNDWDDGAVYPARNGKGLMFTFEEEQSIGSISFCEPVDKNFINAVRLEAYNSEKGAFETINASLTYTRTDNGRHYYTLKWSGEVVTDQIYMALSGWNPLQIAEVKFYSYDSISDDIYALFTDAYNTVLRDDVNEQTLLDLEERLNTPDSVSGEYHPDRELLQKEIDNARSILNTESLGEIFTVKNTITAQSGSGYGFTGLNAWQPLGVVASEGDKLVIYVGAPGKKLGDSTELQVVATQYYAESGEMSKNIANLKVGRNEITVPAINSLDAEHGGALYIQYTGKNGGTQYGVRVSGGTQVPVLNLYEVTDADERLARTQKYIEQLQAYSQTVEQLHNQLHEGEYDAKTCVLNATDILLDEMMISVPVQQVLAGAKGTTTEQKAAALLNSMDAMDDMMELFYQHKGLNDRFSNAKLPSQHLNIRYQRMFGGAFMYAAGNHIGVEWNETAGLMQGETVVTDELGRKMSGNYFGWGISHEIGHNINQGSYAVAEVTNNYFAQLVDAGTTSDSVRFAYSDVYDKVTSGTTGSSSNVFTQMGMYWQLHLAYDNFYNYKTFDDGIEQLANLFYARVDTYARNPKAAPAPGGVALTLTNSTDQNFMRLAMAAAEKDLTDFFIRWGKTPDTQTIAYASQFDKETRAIYYVNDDARNYRIENANGEGFAGKNVVSTDSTVSVKGNAVTLNLTSTVSDSSLILGYEITRVMMSGGQEVRQVVGFTTDDSFVDVVTSINNRVIRYEVTAIDQYLNRSAVTALQEVKITHDGSHDKANWTVTTNMASEDDFTHDATDHDPCEPEEESAITKAFDNDAATVYTGTATSDAWVQMNFNKTLAVTGLKYTSGGNDAVKGYKIELSTNGTEWKTVAEGEFAEGEETSVIYLQNENDDPWVATYDAAYLRFTAVGSANTPVSIAELDVLGPTGDNVDWRVDTDGNETVGILKDNYVYDSATGEYIPEGSLVFIGQYKGNPAYNVVMLFDQDGNIVGGIDEDGALVAQQIILADVPEHGELGETTDGSWIYWVEPNADGGFGDLPESVRVELYRVDNATTNEGQRMVSDSFAYTMPQDLPEIVLK